MFRRFRSLRSFTKRLRKRISRRRLFVEPLEDRRLLAAIAVGGGCTLVDAITNANNDDQSGSASCVAGSGADTITLSADVTLNAVDNLAPNAAPNCHQRDHVGRCGFHDRA